MAKQFKNTHVNHLRSENGNRTKCGIRIDEFTDIINSDGYIVPAIPKYHSFTPYKPEDACICKKCNK